MENKKSLKINCAICDVRGITEEVLAAYDRVQINCAQIITNPAAQALLNRYAAKINTANIINVEENVHLSMVNGSMDIFPGQQIPAEKTILVVNGCLDIAPGSEEILKSYAYITVNGSVECPKSMTTLLSMMTINGSIDAYPDGCIRLDDTVALDRTFRLRAKQDALYYASSRIVAVADNIDFAALAAKNIRFETGELLVSESNAEAAAALVDEQADITIIPDGCAYVDGNAELDENLLHRYGGKLFIDGSLTIGKNGASCLDKLEYLRVDGNIKVVRSLANRAAELDAVYNKLVVTAGDSITDKSSLTVTRALLEQAEDGLDIIDCVKVFFQEDVTAELIREKLVRLIDCASVICTPEQQPALELIAEDVAYLGPEVDEEPEKTPEDENIVRINAASYMF